MSCVPTTDRPARTLLCALVLLAIGCSPGPLTSLRFANRDVVWRLHDQRPIALPAKSPDSGWTRGAHAEIVELLHDMAVPPPQLAMNINSLGEVPDCSWFENRIGRHRFSVEQVARGPGGAGPDLSAPMTVVKGKGSGSSPGFVVEDVLGVRYIVKLDPAAPEAETGAEVVTQRLLWAAGFHVPENNIVYFTREQLELAPDATVKVGGGRKVALTWAALDGILARGPSPTVDGGGRRAYRALASRYLDGVPVGGYAATGVRPDDDNDVIAHQHRRDVRGLSMFFAWVGQTDAKQPNTLDTWIELSPGSQQGYLRHHLLDFGKALGTWSQGTAHEHDGWASHFDYQYAIRSLVSLGLWKRPWEGLRWPELRGVGRFEAVGFDPAKYAPANLYQPFLHTDRFDDYWAAKIIARFSAAQINAAVRQGRYSDPRASAYLTATLIARQRKVLRHGLGQVSPIDHFRVAQQGGGSRICATDLARLHQLADGAGARYVLEAYDWDGRALGFRRELTAGASGELCATGLRPPDHHDGYTMVLYQSERAGQRGQRGPAVIAHLARHPDSGALRVIGVQRR